MWSLLRIVFKPHFYWLVDNNLVHEDADRLKRLKILDHWRVQMIPRSRVRRCSPCLTLAQKLFFFSSSCMFWLTLAHHISLRLTLADPCSHSENSGSRSLAKTRWYWLSESSCRNDTLVVETDPTNCKMVSSCRWWTHHANQSPVPIDQGKGPAENEIHEDNYCM